MYSAPYIIFERNNHSARQFGLPILCAFCYNHEFFKVLCVRLGCCHTSDMHVYCM